MKNKRGAPLGNKNALKHGLYATAFKPAELEHLKLVAGENKDEIELMRLLIVRSATALRDQPDMPLPELLSAMRTITRLVHELNLLMRTQKEIYEGQTSFEQALEELKDLDPDVD